MLALGAQTGPVFMTYRASDVVNRIAATAAAEPPLFDFTAEDGVAHTVWRVGEALRDSLVAAMAAVPELYIADGHHRAARAARARSEIREQGRGGVPLGGGADAS